MKSEAASSALKSSSRILIVRLRSLGDCVLCTPAIHLLKRRKPAASIGVVVEPEWRGVFEGNPDVSVILAPSLSSVWDFKPDLCLDLHGGSRSARLTFFSGAKHRIGFAHFRIRAAYNMRIPRAQDILGLSRKIHTAEHIASAMFYMGIPKAEIPRARLFAKPPREKRAPYAVIHPMAATQEKTWDARGFLRVAEYLRDHHRLDVVFVAGKDQDLSAFSGWETLQGAALSELKTLIAGASLFVGNDSGPAHIAAAFGVPPVVLFGPSDSKIWGPWATPGEVVQAAGPISAIDAADVIAAIDRVTVAA